MAGLRRWQLLWCLCALTLSCRGKKSNTRTELPEPTDTEQVYGLRELRQSLEITVLENYAQLSYGNIEALREGIVSGRPLHLLRVTPTRAVIGPAGNELDSDWRLLRDRSPRALSKGLEVHLSRDGSVAWTADELSYRVQHKGREAAIPVRITQTYIRDLDRWLLVGEHLSVGVAEEDLPTLVAEGRVSSPASFETSYGSERMTAGKLAALVGRFVNQPTTVASSVAPEATLLWTSFRQEVHGSKVSKLPSLSGSFAGGGPVAIKEYQVEVASSGKVAWMVAHLQTTALAGQDEVLIPMRGTFVFQRGQDNAFLIEQAHVSVGLSDEEISRQFLGE